MIRTTACDNSVLCSTPRNRIFVDPGGSFLLLLQRVYKNKMSTGGQTRH